MYPQRAQDVFSIGGNALLLKVLETEYFRVTKDPYSMSSASMGSVDGEVQLLVLIVELIQKVLLRHYELVFNLIYLFSY